MRRAAIALVVVAAVAVAALALRYRTHSASGREVVPGSQQEARPGQAAVQPGAAHPETTPRGDVSIDPRRQQLLGVRTVTVSRSPMPQTIRATGLVAYDETRLTDVNLKVEGWVRDLFVDFTGQPVTKGQPLFTVYSPDILSTESEYLLALKTRDQLQQSQLPEVRQRADDLVASARRRLALWDVSAEDMRTLDQRREPQPVVTVRSPIAGFILEKQIARGAHVTPGQTLYRIADVAVVWVEAAIYEQDLSLVRIGSEATVTVDAYPGESFTGRASYMYPAVDPQTRTIKMRFALANRSARLKPGMFVHVDIRAPGSDGLSVPSDAVVDTGTEQTVFVSLGDGYFAPRRVKIGRRSSERTQVLEGLNDGDQVAAGAMFLLDSESQLRAAVQGYAAAPPTSGTPAPARTEIAITLKTQPDPAKAGENQFEVTVADAAGMAVADAQVIVQFLMPAMPAMSMPAMRSEVKLAPAGGGLYRGTGEILTAGRWDVTVSVEKDGRRIGVRTLTVAAR